MTERGRLKHLTPEMEAAMRQIAMGAEQMNAGVRAFARACKGILPDSYLGRMLAVAQGVVDDTRMPTEFDA